MHPFAIVKLHSAIVGERFGPFQHNIGALWSRCFLDRV
jgi:hypothetical protein